MWTLLRSRQIKVNMDDFFWGGLDREGIEEEFRYSKGSVLLQFCKEVRVELAAEMEVLELLECLLVVVGSHWVSTHSFLFKSNLRSVVV